MRAGKLIDIKYKGGTAKSPQNTKITSISFSDTDKVQFVGEGRLETVQPWLDVTPTSPAFSGICRAIHGVEIGRSGFYYYFGTSSMQYLFKNGSLTNISPLQVTPIAIANSIATTNTSKTIVFTAAAHGQAVGDRVKILGAAATGGIPALSINKEHIITAITAGTFSVLTDTAATSNVAAGGGAATTYQKQIAAGNINQANATGYGYGLYGAGTYGTPKTSLSGLQSYPRTWSYGDFGSDIVMNAGDYDTGDGQKIYIHDGSTTVAPTVLTNAPTDCNHVSVVNNAVVALCGTTIKISDLGDATIWTPAATNTAYSQELQNISRLVCCVPFGDKNALIFSFNEVFLLTYVGGADRWDIRQINSAEGIIAPHAWAKLNNVLYWQGFYNIYRFTGAEVETLPNVQNAEWVNENMNRTQHYKCFATADINNNQVLFHFPTGANNEPSDYLTFSQDTNTYTLGLHDRTGAMHKPVGQRHYYAASGKIYRHFMSDDSIQFAWTATTSEAYLDNGENRYAVTEIYPDANMQGNMTLTVTMREFAQDTMTYSQSYTITPTTQYISIRAAGRLVSLTFSGNYQTQFGIPKIGLRQLGNQ
jgi:hypothetical protein